MSDTKSSCITAPPQMRRVVIKQEYLALCDGMKYPRCAAALLSMFEHWTNYKLDKIEEEKRIIRAAAAKGKTLKPKRSLWIFMSLKDMQSDELYNLFGETQISKSITDLRQAGFIACRENPDKSKRYDRTRQYLFQTKQVQLAIDTWYQNLEAKPYIYDMEAVQVSHASLTDTETIPQITTQIPNTENILAVASPHVDPPQPTPPVAVQETPEMAFEDIPTFDEMVKAHGEPKTLQERFKEQVASVWGYPILSFQCNELSNMLRGVSTNKTYSPANIPASHRIEPEELPDWYEWEMTQGVKGKDKVLIEAPMKIQKSIMKWVVLGKPKVVNGKRSMVNVQFVPTTPQKTTDVNDFPVFDDDNSYIGDGMEAQHELERRRAARKGAAA